MNMLLRIVPWVLVCGLYFPVFKILYSSRWESVDYTHAFFILPVSLWLIARKRRELKELAAAPLYKNQLFYAGLFLLGVIIFIFGWRWEYLAIATLSLTPLVYGLTGALYGSTVVRAIRFPILYLLMLVPPPLGVVDNLTLPMRRMISTATGALLGFLGYPVTREGLLLNVGGHEVFLGQPCSGFRSLVTMIALALIYIYLNNGRLVKKTVLLASVIPLALLGNLIRVTVLCLIAFYFGDEAAQGFFHNFSGLVIFVIIILGLVGIEVLVDRIIPEKAGGK